MATGTTQVRTETRECPCCGRSYEIRLGVRGRRPDHCSPRCALILRRLGELEVLYSDLADDLRSERAEAGELPARVVERASDLRSRTWAIANQLNGFGRPGKRAATKRRARG